MNYSPPEFFKPKKGLHRTAHHRIVTAALPGWKSAERITPHKSKPRRTCRRNNNTTRKISDELDITGTLIANQRVDIVS